MATVPEHLGTALLQGLSCRALVRGFPEVTPYIRISSTVIAASKPEHAFLRADLAESPSSVSWGNWTLLTSTKEEPKGKDGVTFSTLEEGLTALKKALGPDAEGFFAEVCLVFPGCLREKGRITFSYWDTKFSPWEPMGRGLDEDYVLVAFTDWELVCEPVKRK